MATHEEGIAVIRVGGLGNQIFQVCSAFIVSKYNKCPLYITDIQESDNPHNKFKNDLMECNLKSKNEYNVIFSYLQLLLSNWTFNELKNPTSLVQFIAEQFKRLPKNRKQLKLLTFITQSLKIFCQQRKEFLGFKFQLKGRLNRRNRTNK